MLALLFVSAALAEDPTFTGTREGEAAQKPETKLVANAGGTLITGNAESMSFTAGVDGSYRWRRNQLGIVGGAAIGFGAVDANADGFLSSSERCIAVPVHPCSATAERYSLDARYDRFVSRRASLYLLAGGFHDRFAGFDLRTHAQVGYARHLIDRDATTLKVEAGVDVANEDFVAGVVPNSTRLVAAQVAAGYTHKFNEHASLTDTLTIYEPILTQPEGSAFAPHLTDVRVADVAALTTKMSDKLGITVSDTFAWRNEPVAAPEGITEARAQTDNTLAVALVASVL
jgi:putative salt-induced outer membrane protein YdiY